MSCTSDSTSKTAYSLVGAAPMCLPNKRIANLNGLVGAVPVCLPSVLTTNLHGLVGAVSMCLPYYPVIPRL